MMGMDTITSLMDVDAMIHSDDAGGADGLVVLLLWLLRPKCIGLP